MVKHVARKIHLGLVVVAIVVMVWPNHKLCVKFMKGSPQVGMLQRAGALRSKAVKEPMDLGQFEEEFKRHKGVSPQLSRSGRWL